jgi:hypothetical protein
VLFTSLNPAFAIPSAPSWSDTEALFIDLARQARPEQLASLSDSGVKETRMEGHLAMSGNAYWVDGGFHIARSSAELATLLESLADAKKAITVYVSGSSSTTSKHEQASFGTYSMPNTESPLKKREARRPAPAESPPELASKPVESSTSSPLTPLAGNLPSCFSTQTACESSTRNCTGHGKCYKKFTDTSVSEKSSCWTCHCSATPSKSSEGKTITTYWGGPACQKKDISFQFWILALFSVAMVFLIGFAVGEVWGMGNEELPSVIGAGVSGPVKRS